MTVPHARLPAAVTASLLLALAGCGEPGATGPGRQGPGGAADGGSSGEGLGAGAEGGPSDSGAVSEVPHADPEALAAACAAGCKAKQVAPECHDEVTTCTSECPAYYAFADTACAECATKHLWSSSGCSSWECVCTGIQFASVAQPGCEGVCAATIARVQKQADAVPLLSPEGPAPVAQRFFASTYFDGPVTVQDRAWLCSTDGSVTILDDLLGTETVTAAETTRADRYVLSAGPGGAMLVVSTSQGGTQTMRKLDGAGRERLREVLAAPADAGPSSFEAIACAPSDAATTGTTIVALVSGGVRTFDDAGALTGQAASLAAGFTGSSLAIPSEGLWFVFGRDPAQEVSVRTFRAAAPPGGNLAITEIHRRDIPLAEGFDVEVVRPFGPGAAAAGSRTLIRAGTYEQLPAFEAYAADGSTSRTWQASESDTTQGRASDVALAADGSAFVLSAEEAAPPCPPAGCTLLTLRKVDPSGKTLWRYRHRPAAITMQSGAHLAIGASGRVFALVGLSGVEVHDVTTTPPGTLVLAFDP